MSAFATWRKFFALGLLVIAPLALAQRQAPEPELKAAILANMLLFVDWPAQGAQAPNRLTVCYLDAGPVAAALSQLDGKVFKGKPLHVVRVEAATISGCHALYVSPLDAASLPLVVPNLRASGILLVGDSPGYLQRGVMLNLEIDAGRVAFDIDLRSIRHAGLSVSSKVLRLARQVVE
ncbi:YfiR family protein [Rhodoferax ferrireducens]|uniref:YfiR family protein n=1 Tax=Rhodoferax ferrireducens TaxID=192843 RepID=UPI000E0D8B10|nr:YfiR family protein [Rhodoferax ferrireducens]